jgi:hypothetical protein
MPARQTVATLERLMREARQLKERAERLNAELEALLRRSSTPERPERRKRPRD